LARVHKILDPYVRHQVTILWSQAFIQTLLVFSGGQIPVRPHGMY
jgi:hypothetical protein